MIKAKMLGRRVLTAAALICAVPMLAAAAQSPASYDSQWSDVDLSAGRIVTSKDGLVSVRLRAGLRASPEK